MDYKMLFKNKEDENVFLKTTTAPAMGSADKAILNRKGNILYNNGDIESARRIFITTGYSDGLIRIGDYYNSRKRFLDALRMYWTAPDRVKAEPIIMRLSMIIQTLLNEGKNE